MASRARAAAISRWRSAVWTIRPAASACRLPARSSSRSLRPRIDFLLLRFFARHFVQLRRYRVVARRADAVAELRLRMVGDIPLDLLPVLIVAADPLAVAADRQQSVQLLHV